jgi:hypothetical protein
VKDNQTSPAWDGAHPVAAVPKSITVRGEHGPEIVTLDSAVMHVAPLEGNQFAVKDSGDRETYSTGMLREPQEGRPRFDLLYPLDVPYEKQLMTRFAAHMAKGAEKYPARNWEKAQTTGELERFRASLLRHVSQWMAGDRVEDHAAGIMFNLLAFETTAYKMHRQGLETGFGGGPRP